MLHVFINKEYPVGAIIVNIFWACLLGYFALRFDNDPEECMATDENDAKFKTGNDEDRYIDVGEEFRWFFEIGFFSYLGQIGLGIFSLIVPLANILKRFVFLIITLLSYAIIMAWIWGFYIRVSHSGRVCAGDFIEDGESSTGFLIEQGMFIKWITITFFVLVSVAMAMVMYGVLASKPRYN